MTTFATRKLPEAPDVTAPDGSDVRILLAMAGGSMAHFELAPRLVSIAVAHRTVEEIWYFIAGSGEMWRQQGDHEEIVDLEPGISISIPVGTAFQFRSSGTEALSAIAITMPPWPNMEEAYEVAGHWLPRLERNERID